MFSNAATIVGLATLSLLAGITSARDGAGKQALPFGPKPAEEKSTFDPVHSPLDGPLESGPSGAAQSPYHRIMVPPQTDGTAQYFYDMYGNMACEVHFPGPALGDWFYPSSCVLADVNNDGKKDIILGSHPFDPPARDNAGAVFIFFGRGNIFPGTLNPVDADVAIYGRREGDMFGTSVCSGDFNGDGKADLLVGAPNAAHPGAVADSGGAAMLFFGRESWPSVWNMSLSTDSADYEFYGMDAWNWYNRTGTAVVAGDLDGDGKDEAVIFSPSAPAPGARDRVSNTWVFKGRSTWPTERRIELWSNVVTYPYTFGALLFGVDTKDAWIQIGSDPNWDNDYRINNMTCDDVNGDGKDDIMIAFWGADGPTNTGVERGEVRILYGDAGLGSLNGSYPDTFNLATQSDAVIYGEDDYDRMSRVYAADLIGSDNIKDIVVTSRQGAGPGNLRTRCGEAYVILGKPALDATYAMPGGADIFIYGGEESDRLEYAAPFQGLYSGLLLGLGTADGPMNQRTDCGELKFIDRGRFDQLTLPATVDLATYEVMTYAYGASANDRMTLSGQMVAGDVNGDGIDDILAPSPLMCLNPTTCTTTKGKATLINGMTFGTNDIDGDAVDGLCDNCPGAYNPNQLDFDGDGFADACDNCPIFANFGQEDADFDNTGDPCDPEMTTYISSAAVPIEAIENSMQFDVNRDGNVDLIYDDQVLGISIIWGPDWTLPSAKEHLFPYHAGTSFECSWHNYCRFLGGFVCEPDYTHIAFDFENVHYWFYYNFSGPTRWQIFSYLLPSGTKQKDNLLRQSPSSITKSRCSGNFSSDAMADVIITPHHFLTGVANNTFSSSVLPFEMDDVAMLDANGDITDDIAVIRGDSLLLYVNTGTGTFAKAAGVKVGTPAPTVRPSLLTGDFDDDGDMDAAQLLAYADSAFSAVFILYNDGAGGLVHTERIIVNGTATGFALGEANKDNRIDFIVANSTTGQAEIYGRQRFGGFAGPLQITLNSGVGLPLTIGSTDYDRDGNIDLVNSNSLAGGTTVSINQAANLPIVSDDMRVIALDNAALRIDNPVGGFIQRNGTSVAAGTYWRQDVDQNGKLDEFTEDWNAMYGWYTITAKLRPNSPPGSTYSIAIGIDGSQQMIAAEKLTSGGNNAMSSTASPQQVTDSVVFHFLLEATPTISPAFGTSVTTKRPFFNWTGRKSASANSYEVQVDENLTFTTPRVSSPTLSFPAYQPTVDLGLDSVFYWRWREQIGGVWQPWSYPIPVKIVCCVGLTGNVDCDPTDGVDISDLSALIDYLYITFTPLCCKQEGNVDGSVEGNIDISDLSALIDYLYISFTPPSGCQ